MTWRSHIFFESAIRTLVLLVVVGGPALAGTVIGSVRLIDASAARRGNTDYSGVVIWLEPTGGSAPSNPPKTVQLAQSKKHFNPPVLAVPVGTTVTFPNLDPIFHNAFSNYSGQAFDVGLYPPTTVPKILFKRAGIVRVFCNIHPTMSAVIVVQDTPYMAVTGANGSFRIEGIQPGEYRLHVFHEQATEQTMTALQRNLTIGEDALTLAPIEISQSGYIQVPHKNKYGQDYPAVIEDRPIYAPGRAVRK
jgi:plastocyanin